MGRREQLKILALVGVWMAIWLLGIPTGLRAENGTVLAVGKFSGGEPGTILPDGWKPLTFKKIQKLTTYELVKDDAQVVVRREDSRDFPGMLLPFPC